LAQTPKENTENQEKVDKPPRYDFCHIIFNGEPKKWLIQALSKSKKLVYALLSIRYIQFDIFTVDE